eukprot:764290-Hanusia_phi.AAC.1
MEVLYTRTISELHCKARAETGEPAERQRAAEKACTMQGVWRGQGESAVLAEVRKGQADVIAVLVIGGSEVNGRTANGSTALHVAAALGHLHCLQAFVRQQADVNARDDKGETCAHAASRGRQMEALRYLGEVGGRELLLPADEEGQTCAHVASERGHVEALRYLEEVGGRELPLPADEEGQTCAHVASQKEDAEEEE